MRTIKFRALDFNNEWKYGYYTYDSIQNKHFINTQEVKGGTVSQYTGLHDKNSLEIYEGDICRVLYTDWPSKGKEDMRTLDQYLYDMGKNKIVQWDFNGFYFSNSPNGYSEDMDVGKYGYIVVIGNIYDNPELLKEDNDKI